MSVLDQLYSLEIEFHRCYRAMALDSAEAPAVHTSYALQNGYEPLLRMAGVVDDQTLAGVKERLSEGRDPRDVQAAYHSLRQMIA